MANKKAEDLLYSYAEVLGWSDSELVRAICDYVDVTEQTEKLREYLRYRTGLDIEPDPEEHGYRGSPFAVFAYGPAAEHYELELSERKDAEDEALALEAFAHFIRREEFITVVLVRYSNDGDRTLDLLRYDRRDKDQKLKKWKYQEYPDSFTQRL